MLYLVATPIGNLSDISVRAIDTLKSIDTIICEDTRRTQILLNHLQIKKPLVILNDFNENKHFQSLIERLKSGEEMALVSDAGTPLISDPGYKLVRQAIQENIPIDSIPGPTAAITALTLSGLPPDKFMFLGYLPEKPGARQQLYQTLSQISQLTPTTFIGYIAPFKLVKVLEEFAENYPNLEITLAKELTKIHQQVLTKHPVQWLDQFHKTPPKGEWVILWRF